MPQSVITDTSVNRGGPKTILWGGGGVQDNFLPTKYRDYAAWSKRTVLHLNEKGCPETFGDPGTLKALCFHLVVVSTFGGGHTLYGGAPANSLVIRPFWAPLTMHSE